MKISSSAWALLLGLVTLLGSGCTSFDDEERPVERRPSATLLTLADESHQLTPDQLDERRRNVISYLIAEGYIDSGEDLVQSASYADQIIRAKLALDGSFELTIYRPERLAHREVDFDPAGYPVYSYYPGDIGYIGNGFDPYYLPVTPYYGPRYPHHRHWSDRDRDYRRPDQTYPAGRPPDWDRNHRRPYPGDRDHHDEPQNPPSTPPREGDRDRRHDHNRHRNDNRQEPPQHPAQPPAVAPGEPPVQPPPAPPNPRRSGPDRQPWGPHQQPAPRPQAIPAPTNTTPQPQSSPPPQPNPTDHRRFRPELQPQPSPAPASRPAPTTPPPATQNRNRPDGAPPRTTPPPTRTPPPARTPPQHRTVPEPAKDQSNKSDSSTQNSGSTSPDDRRR